jgi:hypothetical protein
LQAALDDKVPYTGATGDVDLGEYELKAGQIEFDQTPTGSAGVGVMRWNDTDGTVDVGLKGGNVTLQVGQESVIRVVNKSGSNLLEANYQAVRVRLVAEGGAQGQRLAVVLALADTDADSATTIGLVTETINNNQEGFVTTSGEVKNINTTGSLQGETWVDGDILYLSGTTSGRITNVKPSAPTHTIIIGYVVYAHANNGKIFVKVDNGYELDELHNVSITSPTDNQALVYESVSSLWKNETVDKTFVGLGNVDNTSDANKPISTATQTALNAKQDTLGFTPENTANKQNSLTTDGTGTKYPTIDAVNSLSMIDRGKRIVSFFTDFIGFANTQLDGLYSAANAASVTSTNKNSFVNNSPNQQGFALYTTAVSASSWVYHLNSNAFTFSFGNGIWNYESSIMIANLSTSTERFRTIHGFGANATGNPETNGVFFTYEEGGTINGTSASPNWQCVTVSGNVRTLTVTSIPIQAQTWYILRIQVNASGSEIKFFINGVLCATHITNIPSNFTYLVVKQGIAKVIGTTARLMYSDYIGYENILTTPRT